MNQRLEITALIEHQLSELEHPHRRLTAWELDFLESVQDQFNRRGWLSEKQQSILARIYKERAE